MTESSHNEEQYSVIRRIFLNLFIIAFVTISYIYLSEPFGSISTIYIGNQEITIHFSVSLLLFTFLSVLAGPINGLITGFLGEFLFQLAFYGTIYLEWCLIIAIYGFLVGIYKYHPLKYHRKIDVFYSFIALLIASFIVFWIIIVFQIIFYPGLYTLVDIFVNYGIKFLLSILVSVLFTVPILLFLYDNVLAKEEKEVYRMFLTHHPLSASDHTFYLKFGRTKIYFCSRCSGVILGGLIALFTTYLLFKIYQVEFSAEIAILLCIILPIPGLIDWGTQRLLLRKSSTESRLFTGFIIGLALHFMSYTYKYYFYTMIILTIYFSIFGLLVYFGHKKEMKILKEEMNEVSIEHES
ncbi:MAG: DUF2085 domain-containing protein [Candidatus Hermodarchaeota archaeon]